MVEMMTKEMQNKIKAEYATEMTKHWSDSKMIKYCTNKNSRFIKMSNGNIITIEKPSIETNFCFGYSLSRYDSEDFDRANDMAYHAKESELYFIRENMKEMKNNLIEMKKIRAGKSYNRLYTQRTYDSKTVDSKAYSWFISSYAYVSQRNIDCTEMCEEDMDNLIIAYKMEILAFHKRLRTYLKKYGMSKVHTWSYWRDI